MAPLIVKMKYGKIEFEENWYKKEGFKYLVLLKFLPFKIEYDYCTKRFILEGESELFDDIEEERITPTYCPVIYEDEIGNISIKEIRRVD